MTELQADDQKELTQKDFVDRAEIALQKIRDVVSGNLFHPLEDVDLVSYEEIEITFEAQTRFQIHAERTERVLASSAPGMKKVKSVTDLNTLIDKDIKLVIGQEQVLATLRDDILKRDDRGYFVDKLRTPLGITPLQYLREEPCLDCRGQKYVDCLDCHGMGHIRCRNCDGKTGENCTICKGKGKKQCIKCQTKGRRECHKCHAAGTIHHVTNVKLFADSLFSYDKTALPEVAIPVIERLREKLITKDHAIITVSDDINSTEKDHAGSLMTLSYQVTLPLGDATFRIGEENVPALLFGYKTALLDVPPFLERYMLGPFNLLREAANGQGQIAEKIRAATFQTRLTHEAVIGIATDGFNKTEKRLKHDYSIALEPQFIRNLLKTARAATNRLTLKPQMIGLGLGLIPAFILTLLYIFPFDSGGINSPQLLRMLCDLIFATGIAFLPYLGAQLLSRQSMIYALGEGIKDKIRLPKLGIQGLWGPGIAVFLFLLFAESAYRAEPLSAPQFYSFFRSLFS